MSGWNESNGHETLMCALGVTPHLCASTAASLPLQALLWVGFDFFVASSRRLHTLFLIPSDGSLSTIGPKCFGVLCCHVTARPSASSSSSRPGSSSSQCSSTSSHCEAPPSSFPPLSSSSPLPSAVSVYSLTCEASLLSLQDSEGRSGYQDDVTTVPSTHSAAGSVSGGGGGLSSPLGHLPPEKRREWVAKAQKRRTDPHATAVAYR